MKMATTVVLPQTVGYLEIVHRQKDSKKKEHGKKWDHTGKEQGTNPKKQKQSMNTR